MCLHIEKALVISLVVRPSVRSVVCLCAVSPSFLPSLLPGWLVADVMFVCVSVLCECLMVCSLRLD